MTMSNIWAQQFPPALEMIWMQCDYGENNFHCGAIQLVKSPVAGLA